MHTIENDHLRVTINSLGGELTSLFNKSNDLEYLWKADPAFWSKRSPVLFPVVGSLKNNQYIFEGKKYELSRHGFAREKNFTVAEQTPASIKFSLQQDESTLKLYPFYFTFSIMYSISGNKLSVTYIVQNEGDGAMYFSVGGHPAFNVPMAPGLSYEDYYLEFNKVENAERWPINKEGLLETTGKSFLANTERLPLTKELFYKDALVFKDLRSNSIKLCCLKNASGLDFSFEGFPYFGIWAAKNADFICLEPWCGVADSISSTQDLTGKEGINQLSVGGIFERTWTISIY